MKKRVFLIVLIFFLLLAAMANQHLQNPSALMGSGEVLGFIPLWQLYNVLPSGIFAAGVCAVALGMGAEFWRALLTLCGAGWSPSTRLSRLADAGLWCGWTTLAACLTALGSIFPWSVGAPGAYGPGLSPTTFFDIEHYRLALIICGGVMILCRVLSLWLRERAALLIVVLVAASALVCGQFWCRALPVSYFGLTLLLPWAVLLLWGGSKLRPQQYYMTIAALGMALYGVAFEPTIGSYVIDVNPTDNHYAFFQPTLNALILLGLLLIALALRPLGLLRRPLMQRILGAGIILCCLRHLWHLVAAAAVGQQITELHNLSVGCYTALLLCVGGLIFLRLWATHPIKTEEK